MKISELLTENTIIKSRWKVDAVDLKKGIDLLNKHCKLSLNDIASGQILWRGMKTGSTSRVLVMDSTAALRTSRDSNNIYQLMMDQSTALAAYPKRSNSFICTGDFDIAQDYGSMDTYAMFPFDGVKVAISSAKDLFRSRVFGIEIDDLSQLFGGSLADLGIKPDASWKYTDANKINEAMGQIPAAKVMFVFMSHFDNLGDYQEAYEYYDDNRGSNKIISTNVSKVVKQDVDIKLLDKAVKQASNALGKKVYSILAANPKKMFTAISSFVMTPKELELKLSEPGKLATGDSECWFSGKCVAVQYELFLEILDEMQRRKMKVGPELRRVLWRNGR